MHDETIPSLLPSHTIPSVLPSRSTDSRRAPKSSYLASKIFLGALIALVVVLLVLR